MSLIPHERACEQYTFLPLRRKEMKHELEQEPICVDFEFACVASSLQSNDVR